MKEKGWDSVNDSQSLMGLGGLLPPSVLLNWGSRTWGQRPVSSCKQPPNIPLVEAKMWADYLSSEDSSACCRVEED